MLLVYRPQMYMAIVLVVIDTQDMLAMMEFTLPALV